MSNVVNHWINGVEYVSKSGRTSPIYDPALGTETKRVALANQSEIDAAIKAARDSFPAWRDASLAKRQQIIFTFRELLNSRKGELAEIITSEHGKVLSDALGEITRGQEVVEFATGIPHLLKGFYSENVSTGVDVYSTRQPLGVVGIISPFNFPAMVPMWFFPIAIAAGNTVVIKPSEKDPSASMWVAKLWKEAGLPDGVFNVLNGDKESVDGLLNSPDVESISFVGSTPIAKYIYENASRTGKRVQALGGAKNHMLVLPDADLELVADSAINAGFGSAGERCMAISVVVAVEPVADQLIPKIVERMGKLRTGDGRRGCDMGPLVTREHRDKVASYVDIAEKDGATILVGGSRIDREDLNKGWYFPPTVIDDCLSKMKCVQDESFGPIMTIETFESVDEAIALGNDTIYGLAGAVWTKDIDKAQRVANQLRHGTIWINDYHPYVPQAEWGGFKQSGFGRELGPMGLAEYQEAKHVWQNLKPGPSNWFDGKEQ